MENGGSGIWNRTNSSEFRLVPFFEGKNRWVDKTASRMFQSGLVQWCTIPWEGNEEKNPGFLAQKKKKDLERSILCASFHNPEIAWRKGPRLRLLGRSKRPSKWSRWEVFNRWFGLWGAECGGISGGTYFGTPKREFLWWFGGNWSGKKLSGIHPKRFFDLFKF